MASIDKLGEGRGYKVRWREGMRARSKTVATFSEARALRASIEADGAPERIERVEPIEEPRPGPAVAAPPSWDLALLKYLEECSVSCRPGTVRGRAYELAKFAGWAEGQGIGPLDIRAPVLVAFFEHLKGSPGRGGAPRQLITVTTTARIAEAFAKWIAGAADDYGWPAPRGLRKVRLPRVQRPMTRAPTLGQVEAMIAQLAARALVAPSVGAVSAYRIAVVQRWTGARVGEVAAARWRDLDLVRREWVIPRSKTQQGRAVPLHPELVERLTTWCPDPGALLVGGHVEATGRGRRLAQAWAEAGVERELWELRTSHAIRRAVRTALAAAGVPDDLRDVLLGHGRGVIDRYEDLRALWPRLEAAVEALGAGAAPVSWRVSSAV